MRRQLQTYAIQDYLTSCYCFVVLTGVFLEDREVQAATLNATSAFTSLALVVQAWQRQAVSAGTITVVALGATLSLILLLAKWLNLRIANGAGYLTWHVWPAWQDLLAVFGAGMVWQVDLPAWCATLLLMMMSAAQLVHVLVLPVGSLAAGMRTLLQALAMGLMVPRALRISNLMFFTGVSFCALASWLAMHVVFFRSGLPSSWCVVACTVQARCCWER
ncbi:hypothetical protein WJX72_012171 [[Myrmecia] bisecta]|uniref:Solute carrier family 40 protein n=1 Tax=[Myrmecia] bisecta TaxID=41462 RepID=A0AAW1RB32_9CHLO